MIRQQNSRMRNISKLVKSDRRRRLWCRNSVGYGRKREQIFIENDISRNIDTICGNMETLVPFMEGAISKEDTFFGTILELVFVIWTKVWPTRTTEDFEKGVVRDLTKQASRGVFISRTRVGSLLMRKQAVVTASLQNRKGRDACARSVRPVSTTCLCFLSATPFC
jgi:hypothetical protein